MGSLCAHLQEACLINDDEERAWKICEALMEQPSILVEAGCEDIIRDAYVDGSSVVCTRCGDLIARTRWKAHREMWCSVLENAME